ncbi:MAG: hypothetical protein ACI9UQ_002623, partial [Candidatus Krumholzibacteriia bacterium]
VDIHSAVGVFHAGPPVDGQTFAPRIRSAVQMIIVNLAGFKAGQ